MYKTLGNESSQGLVPRSSKVERHLNAGIVVAAFFVETYRFVWRPVTKCRINQWCFNVTIRYLPRDDVPALLGSQSRMTL